MTPNTIRPLDDLCDCPSLPLPGGEAFTPSYGPLLALACRILGCPDLAWDAVQEALIALWQSEPPPARPQAWLAQAVVNRSLHQLRTLSRRRDHECRAAAACHLTADPARTLEATELSGLLRRAIEALPPEFREAFVLRELGELDYAEIARIARVPVGTVRSRIHRARCRLRQLLEAEVGAPRESA